jgi:methylated-DNA-[protein]-cysteine S-methyltransferase
LPAPARLITSLESRLGRRLKRSRHEHAVCAFRHRHRSLRHRLERRRYCRAATPRGRPRAHARASRQAPDASEAAPPPAVGAAIDTVVTLVSSAAPDRIGADLEAIALDLEDTPAFDRQVYAVARTIAPGETLTYGEIAARIGEPDAAREVGQALGRNRIPIIVPCHRVVAAGGRTGGFSANGGVDTKLRLLEIERATFTDGPTLFDDDAAFARLQPAQGLIGL